MITNADSIYYRVEREGKWQKAALHLATMLREVFELLAEE